ncbi:MAG: hypothetical protein HOJ81_03595 [Flavobacteriales bacterium]|nr:hypothetical protein [Flavobacteriales bacterium]
MRKLSTLLSAIILIGILASSCRIFNPSVMLRAKKNFPYTMGADTVPEDHTIQPGDILAFRLYSNQGFKIIDLTSIEEANRIQANQNASNTFTYLVEPDSSVNLPIIGRVKIAGMNLVVAEEFLEEKYSNYYNDPFVVLEVRNRRIVVFPGQGGDARVIDITNEYVTIIEALAMAGGLSEGGKAHRIKVLRGSLDNPTIYKLDLSTTQGLAEANMYYVKANDIIYVEPSYFAGRQILQTTSQVLSLVSSSILTYFLILQLQNSATP